MKRIFARIACLSSALCIAGLADAATLPSFDRVRVLENPVAVSEIELVSNAGTAFSLADLKGKPVLVFFGFTNCPDVCPATLSRMQIFYDARPDIAAKVEFLLVSVDGERDSPEVLDGYLQKFDERFLGATGAPEVVRRVASEFRAPFYKDNPTNDGQKYSIAHSPAVFVLDAEGLLRAELYNAPPDSIVGIADALLEGD